jgi:hypothetical protein
MERKMFSKHLRISTAIFTLFIALNTVAQKSTSDAALQAEAKKIAQWGKDPVLIKAVKEQNAKKASLSDIQAIDKQWMDGKDTLSAAMAKNSCSSYLKSLEKKHPTYDESFVMDNQGANVCMTNRTSDYWQGDEAKWQKSFEGGKGAIFIDERKYDSSAKAIIVQISVPVMDGDKAIGAITVGIKVD